MSDVVSRNNSSPQMHNHKRSSRRTPRRPVTPGKGKATTGRDLWMAALKKRQTLLLPNTYRPGSPRHKTPTEYFIDTLRKTGVGISAETNKSQSLTGLKGNGLYYPYLSTSHYMRNVLGTEKFPRTAEDPAVRANAGMPAYKTQEEYYDEVLGLRKQIAALTFESATNKTKIRRLEEENAKKEKEIDSLLNPEKNAELRRTMGDRQADSGAIVHSLKQKILKLEMQLRDKESAFCKLQADLKSTKVEEMRVQLETVYAELMRLQLSKDTGTDKPKSASNNAAKIKALNETVIRLSRSNEQLQAENKSLKEDLDRAMQDSVVQVDTKKEYEDMNRAELLTVIANLEKKQEQFDVDGTSLFSQESSRMPQGKMELQGSLEDRLGQLDKRESELLDEVTRLKTVVKKSREDNKRINDTASLPPTPRRRQSKQMEDEPDSRPTSARYSSRRSSVITQKDMIDTDKRHQGPSEEENAANKIQTVGKNTKANQKVKAFRENRAAKKLQHGWLDYKKRRYDEEIDDAAFTIQEALKGTRARRRRMQQYTPDDYDSSSTVTDDGVYLIQSSLKGHRSQKQNLQNWRNQYSDSDDNDNETPVSSGTRRLSTTQRSPSIQMQKSPRRPSSGSMSLGRPPTAQRPSSASSSKRGSITHTFKAKYGPTHTTESADDDDDIMF
ncbi:hypothetical protein BsWGS_06043 [Bradybaena similaris]